MKIHYQRLEKYGERKDGEWRTEEQSHGTYENDQPTVKEFRPLAGHLYSGREMGSVTAAMLVAGGPLLDKGSAVKLYGDSPGVNESSCLPILISAKKPGRNAQ
jgi:hypothetical protein